jgi:hypothetical protein
MGCDSSYMRGYEEPILRKQLDEVTRLLCGVLTIVEKDSIMLSVRGMVPGLPEWWDKHKEADRKRLEKEAQEQARQEQKRLRKQQRLDLLARLTPEERALLEGR